VENFLGGKHQLGGFLMLAFLAHTEHDVTAIYDQYDMLSEKRKAAITLGTAIDAIVTK
jgi:hypothetical protein